LCKYKNCEFILLYKI